LPGRPPCGGTEKAFKFRPAHGDYLVFDDMADGID